ncbi:MarR family transcriptional regulator [Streptomyces sp. WI04-05B]|uniref:MarR family transcriptional regulator n=1 Tax=Streptomyces TaxID=1883 RepID=UPI0029BA081D|nr:MULTISPECIES: MarR family transcriptional regulator [unclassified Streptomyces]MDX2542276.1 MarR family transcriptional regulator [Streptomyces sp. WI04-05B]MDX2584108.1 MarR family transcriptional regulator [Streptomyces sp. WI04-05A]
MSVIRDSVSASALDPVPVSASPDSLGRVGYGLLLDALAECGQEEYTGALRAVGSPGGAFHFRRGLVVGVESPGAPGPEALLLRSRRISGEEWAELVREAGGARWPGAELIRHGYAGAAQLRVVCMMALRDAVFAVVAGRVDVCERDPGAEPSAPVPVGEGPVRLLQDANRKLAALAALSHPVRPNRERPSPSSVPLPIGAGQLNPVQQELLAEADGRRTARDLAFRTGRGVYAVTVEVARMLGAGLLECVEGAAPLPVVRVPQEGLRQRRPPPPPLPPPPPPLPPPYVDAAVVTALAAVLASDAQPVPRPASPPQAPAPALPRREPGASGITETLAPEKRGTSWKGFFRMRNGTHGNS